MAYSFERFMFDYIHNDRARDRGVYTKPNLGYIDAGVALLDPIVLKHSDILSFSHEELEELDNLKFASGNIYREHDVAKNQHRFISDTPCITTLEKHG